MLKTEIDMTNIWYTNFPDYKYKDLVGVNVVYQWGKDYDHLKRCVTVITKSSIIGFRIKKNPKLLFDFMGLQKYPFITSIDRVSDVFIISDEEAERLKEEWKKYK